MTMNQMDPQNILSIVANEQCGEIGNMFVSNGRLSAIIREAVVSMKPVLLAFI